MAKFTVEPFKGPEGVEEGKFVIKLRRRTVHPGVMSKFIAEALGVEDATEASFEYKRGDLCHMWTVSTDELTKLKDHMGTFTSETLMAHFTELRSSFPKAAPATGDDLLASLADAPKVEDAEDDDGEPEDDGEQD